MTAFFSGAEERFDFQILFDPLEKYFHVPARSIPVGNGTCGQPEIVGEKHVDFFGFPVMIGYHPEFPRVFCVGCRSGELDNTVGDDPFIFGRLLLSENGVLDIAFRFRHEKELIAGQGIQPFIVDVGAIDQKNAVRRE